MDLVFADEVAHGAVGDNQFVGQDAAGAVHGGEQVLGDNALQGIGQLEDDLLLGAALKDADNAFEGMGDAGGVHRGQNEVAGFRRREGRGDGLEITNLTHRDDIRGPGTVHE